MIVVFRPKLEVDGTFGTAYVTFSNEKIVATEEVTQTLLVDLDRYGVVVGVEFLDLSEQIPYDKLTHDYHVHSGVIEALKALRPSISSSIFRVQHANDSAVKMRGTAIHRGDEILA